VALGSPQGRRRAGVVGAIILLLAGGSVLATGDRLGKTLPADQPMKLAAAEGLSNTEQGAPFSVFTIWGTDGKEIVSLKVPNVLSFLATGDFNGTVQGIDDLQAQYEAQYPQYGSINYAPIIPVTFWSFRFMMGAGGLAALIALWFLWKMRKGGLPGRGAVLLAAFLPLLPLAANSFAWIFTEMGRQPWIVQGTLLTANGVSPNVTSFEMAASLIGFTLLYGALAVVEVGLILKRVRAGLPEIGAAEGELSADRPAAFAY
jgi:cytochrome d ubiquinol oxidase subunit I